jgi:hypothetical protein
MIKLCNKHGTLDAHSVTRANRIVEADAAGKQSVRQFKRKTNVGAQNDDSDSENSMPEVNIFIPAQAGADLLKKRRLERTNLLLPFGLTPIDNK